MEGGGFLDDVDRLAEAEAAAAAEAAGDEVAAPHRAGCTQCASLSWDPDWLRTFGMRLCKQCQRQEKLVAKSIAKQRYYLTDGDLKRLGFLRKPNPHKKDWQPMHLYLESQVAAVSHEKYGGAEGLEAHHQELLDKKLRDRMQKREREKEQEDREVARLERIKRRIQEEDESRQQQQEGRLAGGGDPGVEVEEI